MKEDDPIEKINISLSKFLFSLKNNDIYPSTDIGPDYNIENHENIEDIQVGEYVMSYNETTKEFEPKKVIRTITKHHSDDLVYVNLSNGERIGMRAYHPLLTTEGYKSLRPEFVETKIEAGKIEKLQVGDTLIGYETNVTITSIEQRDPIENYDTYSLTVEDNHNYIVNGVVAHNGCSAQQGLKP